MNKVIIFSGGLDSTVLLYDVVSKLKEGEILYCLNYFYGQKNAYECTAAQKIVDDLKNKTNNKVINYNISLKHVFEYLSKSALLNGDYDIPKARDVLGDPQPLSYVPNRNMIMLSVATGLAESTESNEVFYGAQQADTLSGYWDASTEFLKSINVVLNLNRKNSIKIQAPLIDLNKEQIIKLGIRLNVPFKDTWTCYDPQEGGVSCGECVACANRLQGFINAGIKDPMPYKININWNSFGII
jgi:7-cyano-7-deazaguanine synthase